MHFVHPHILHDLWSQINFNFHKLSNSFQKIFFHRFLTKENKCSQFCNTLVFCNSLVIYLFLSWMYRDLLTHHLLRLSDNLQIVQILISSIYRMIVDVCEKNIWTYIYECISQKVFQIYIKFSTQYLGKLRPSPLLWPKSNLKTDYEGKPLI